MQGNIMYRFPSLQRTGSSPRSGRKEYVGKRFNDWIGGVGKFFMEKKWQFRFSSFYPCRTNLVLNICYEISDNK